MVKAKERRLAQQLMNGQVDFGNGGTYTLSERPDWKAQSKADTSGNRHVNSLNWALPLLYRGVHKQNAAMVERFRTLLQLWIADHQGDRNKWVDASIYGGLRTQTLVCAAQTLNDPVIAQAALADAARMLNSFKRDPSIAVGSNNTDLIRQTGALAAYCWAGDAVQKEVAWRNVVSVARGTVMPDGSDVEGSPGYAMYMENLLSDVERAGTSCGLAPDEMRTLRGLLYAFVAQAVRPDFALASIGDTVNEAVRGNFGEGDWRADWVRTGGTAGSPPTPVYTAFDGGYVFGRSSWRPQAGKPDTFYSVRYTSNRPATPHTHDDGASMTIFAKGVDWIGDPGPYRYDNSSALRWYMKSRQAHSSFDISNVKRLTRTGMVTKLNSRSDAETGGDDTTCVRDESWNTVAVTRCIAYVRSVDAFVVVDSVQAERAKGPKRKRKIPRVLTQRWQLPPEVAASNTGDSVVLTSGAAAMDIAKSFTLQEGPERRWQDGSWVVQTARPKSTTGWFTGSWGEKLPGSVLSREVRIPKRGGAVTMVTVLVPRAAGEAVPVEITDSSVKITRQGSTVTVALPKAT